MLKLPSFKKTPKKKTPEVSVNLLPQDPFLDSVIGKFLSWSLSIGRYLVILTEFIVITSFLSRFKLDRDLTDITESIVRQKAVIASYQEVETNFRSVQDRINFMNLQQQNNSILTSLDFIEKNIPIDTKLTQLNLQPTSWSLTASSITAQGMKATIDRIVAQNPQSDVSLGEVKLNSRTGTIDFSVRVNKQIAAKQQSKTTPTELKEILFQKD